MSAGASPPAVLIAVAAVLAIGRDDHPPAAQTQHLAALLKGTARD